MYEQHGPDPRSEHRPHKDVFDACLSATRSPETLTVGVIDEICGRWQKTRILRELYTDAKVFADFEWYREEFIEVASALRTLPESVFDPGTVTMGLVTPGFGRVIDLNLPKERTSLDVWEEDFTARFHRSLCLHSIAISSRMIVKAVAEDPENDAADIFDKACDAWAKDRVTSGDNDINPTLADKVDSLETWDFIYNFLLRKLFPLSVMSDWIMACKSDPILQDVHGEVVPTQVCDRFLDALRHALHPEDMVDAIVGQAWKRRSGFGGDKYRYMAIRGNFDWAATGLVDFHTFHSRKVMVESLNIWDVAGCGCDENSVYPWDRFRHQHGSPFDPNFDWWAFASEADSGSDSDA